MDEVNSRKKILLIIVNFLLIISLVAAYFFFIAPLDKRIVQVKTNLEFEKQLLEAVELNAVETTKSNLDIKSLQRRVPVLPLVDQFIFDLEKAEVFSNSFITSYNFSINEFTGKTPIDSNANGSTDSSQTVETPSDIRRLTVNLAIISPGYEELVDFLKRVEKLERITNVDSLTFTGFSEVTRLEDTADDIVFSVAISTFFLPDFEEFIEYIPSIDYPQEKKKYNPLYYRVKGDNQSETNE